jgi:hypothetical protein
MKKNLLLILMFAGLAIQTQAQNTYLSISNAPTVGGRFVIPNNDAINVTAAQSKTITFRIMIPAGVSNNTNFSKIMMKNDAETAGNGQYGITFGSASTTSSPHTDIRVLATSTVPTKYGNANNNSLATTLNDGNWHHFALVLNDNTDPTGNPVNKTRLYYDGALLATATPSTASGIIQTGSIDMTSVANLVFGAAASGGTSVSGMAIDDIRIWDYAFTPTQIGADKVAEIHADTAPTTTGLLAAYDFQSPATLTVVPDITGKTLSANAIVGSSATALATGASVTLANKEFIKNAMNVSIATNRTTGIINISAPQSSAAISVSVFDLTGKVVGSSKSNDTTANVSLSNVSSGVYLVKVTDGVSTYTQKIIKN